MAERLFSLAGVPEDEAAEVRALLTRESIDFYETPPSKWGISSGMIWLHDDSQLERAKALLADYQATRFAEARARYLEDKAQGRVDTLFQRFLRNPIQFFFYLAIVILLLYLSIRPFHL